MTATLVEHACVDCKVADPQPPKPRPAPHGGPRSRRCATHWRVHRAAKRERAADTLRTKRYGITAAQYRELVAAQGGACACGRVHGTTRRNGSPIKRLATDHDHRRQAECVAAGRHDDTTCCELCVRGALGGLCNTEIVGRFTPEQLESLAAYMRRPTAQRLGWWPSLTATPAPRED